MAILIRETRIIDGQEFCDVKVYKSDKFPISPNEEKQALKLDHFISELFIELLVKVKKNGLINLRNKPGVIELWYFVGNQLKFIDNPRLVEPGDKKFIWKAIWQHAGVLAPGEMKTRAGTNRDHVLDCYKLAKYDWDLVISAGSWRTWIDFFDSPIMNNDFVMEWFEKRVPQFKKLGIRNWLRKFLKCARNRFYNVDLSFLTRGEINGALDDVFDQLAAES